MKYLLFLYHICYRTELLKFHKDEYLEKLNQINQMNISSEDKETLLKDIFMPIYEYIKIHGLDETYKGHLDITRITVKSWIDGSPYFNIKRQSLNIKDVLSSRKNEKIEEISEAEYNIVFNEVIKQFN